MICRPVKKDDFNSVLNVKTSAAYENLIASWRGETSALGAQQTFDAVMDWAENHKIENCEIQYDVIDAMFRQPFTDEVIPYRPHKLTEPIFCSEFDLGKNGFAYFDNVVWNVSMDFDTWNSGWSMRNDGVDIESCSDVAPNNGYSVGWTEDGEWMGYSLHSDSATMFALSVRHASGGSGSTIHIEADGVNVSGFLTLPGTGGWGTWQTTTFDGIVIPEGDIQLRLVFDVGGSNLNYFKFENPRSVDEIDFTYLSAETSEDGTEIYVSFNKEITSDEMLISDFELLVDDAAQTINRISRSDESAMVLVLGVDAGLYSDQDIVLSYQGSSVTSGDDVLQPFTQEMVDKKMAESLKIPGKIQAEDFYINYGFELEDCSDVGNGYNTSYSNYGDFLVYKVHVTRAGYYRTLYRVATEKSNAQITLQVGQINAFTVIDTVSFESTGGWQNWDVQNSSIYLEEGYYYIRIFVKQSEFNLNWLQFNFTSTATQQIEPLDQINLYPNPARNHVTIALGSNNGGTMRVDLMDLQGKVLLKSTMNRAMDVLDTHDLVPGIYLVKIFDERRQQVLKLRIE